MKKRTLLLALMMLSTILFTSVSVTNAQPFKQGKKHNQGAGIAQLLMKFDLSSEQKTAIADTLRSYQAQLKASHKAVREAKKGMHQAAHSDELNEAAISSAAQELGAAIGELAIVRSQMKAAVLSALSPEQQQELKDEREQRKERHEQRRTERKERGPSVVEQWVDRHASS